MSTRITGGEHKGRRLSSGGSTRLRPTTERVRGAIFSILGPEVVQGARVLDLYAGTGALGLEALSRGAAWADFVEADARLSRQIREALRELSLGGRAQVHHSKVERALDSLTGAFDLVFADPPYEMAIWDLVLGRMGEGDLMREGGLAVVEHRYRAPLAERYGRLARVTSRRYGDTSVTVYRHGATNG